MGEEHVRIDSDSEFADSSEQRSSLGKRKHSQITDSDGDGNKTKRPRLEDPLTSRSTDLQNFNYSPSFADVSVVYATKKSLGTKLNPEALFAKLAQVGRTVFSLNDGIDLQPRSVYLFCISRAGCNVSIQPPGLQADPLSSFPDKTLLQLKTGKKGTYVLHITGPDLSAMTVEIRIQQKDFKKLSAEQDRRSHMYIDDQEETYEPNNSADYFNHNYVQYQQPQHLPVLNAIFVSFGRDHFRVLEEVLQRLEFVPQVASQNCQLWSRKTLQHWNVLVYPNFGMETLMTFSEHILLADGILVLLPQQSLLSCEVSEIEFPDGSKLPLLTTIGLSERIQMNSLPTNVQAVVAMLKNKRDPNCDISVVHQATGDDLASYIPSWLSIGLKSRSPRGNLVVCFKYERSVSALTLDAQLTLHNLGVAETVIGYG